MKNFVKNQITPIEDHKQPVVLAEIRHYLQQASSQNTRAAYEGDLRHFIKWGGKLPAVSPQILHYLVSHAEVLKPGTLSRRLTAIKQWHISQGFADPTQNSVIRDTLKGIQKSHGTPARKAPAIRYEQLKDIVSSISSRDLMSLRNRALFLIAFFGALRVNELLAIEYNHLRFVKEGVEILLPRSKTDQAGDGSVCAIPQSLNNSLCPVQALRDWLEGSQITNGFIFRRFKKGGSIGEQGIGRLQCNLILKEIAKKCGFSNSEQFSSHGFRSGFATTAGYLNLPMKLIMKQGRWKSEKTALGYIDEGRRFEDNAATMILDKFQKNNSI